MKKTHLNSIHRDMGAKMAPFAGWDMPIQYTSILAEHRHTRNAVSLFDTCHMGQFLVAGDPLQNGLERIVTVPLSKLRVNRCRYGFMLNHSGGTIDDLIVYRLAPEKWMIVVNAGHIKEKAQRFKEYLSAGTTFENRSDSWAKIDIQGPLSRKILVDFTKDDTIGRLPYFGFGRFSVAGKPTLVSRTGYTGELGFEIYVPADRVEELWRQLLALPNVQAAGLGARDTLRMEMGYPLYGQDLDEHTTPIEAGMSQFIDPDKDFIGKEKIMNQHRAGTKRLLAGLVIEGRRSPRSRDRILSAGREIGTVTSGGFSPSLEKGIGMGYVLSECIESTKSLTVQRKRAQLKARITELPLYKDGTARRPHGKDPDIKRVKSGVPHISTSPKHH